MKNKIIKTAAILTFAATVTVWAQTSPTPPTPPNTSGAIPNPSQAPNAGAITTEKAPSDAHKKGHERKSKNKKSSSTPTSTDTTPAHSEDTKKD